LQPGFVQVAMWFLTTQKKKLRAGRMKIFLFLATCGDPKRQVGPFNTASDGEWRQWKIPPANPE